MILEYCDNLMIYSLKENCLKISQQQQCLIFKEKLLYDFETGQTKTILSNFVNHLESYTSLKQLFFSDISLAICITYIKKLNKIKNDPRDHNINIEFIAWHSKIILQLSYAKKNLILSKGLCTQL